ncbi:hypothetical protein [Lacinutrix salivirga]
MSTYPKYKPVTFEYVKQIPEDWEFLPNIALFEESKQKGFPNEELLAVSIKKGVTKTGEIDKKDSSNEDKSNYKLLNIGEIAYNPMRMWQGALGLSPYKGIVSPAYIVLKAKKTLNTKFYHYLFRTNFYTKYSKQHSYGLCDDQLKLRYPQFKRMYSFVPPIETQNQIVAYLEEKEKQIKKFIKKKKQLIISLKNQKINIINETIHKGLNSNYKTVKTDIGYTLYHPENWNKKPLKYVVKHVSENTNQYKKGEYYLPLENIVSYFGEHTYQNEDVYFESNVKRFKENDVLFSKLRPYLTKSVVAQVDGLCVGEILVFRPRKEINPEFLNYILLSQRFIDFVNSSSYGTKMPRASWDLIGRVEISYPKDLELQKEIVLKIKNKLNNIDRTIEKTSEEIKLAEDLLKSQIEQVVTGKIQVPNTFNDYINIAAEPITIYKTL